MEKYAGIRNVPFYENPSIVMYSIKFPTVSLVFKSCLITNSYLAT